MSRCTPSMQRQAQLRGTEQLAERKQRQEREKETLGSTAHSPEWAGQSGEGSRNPGVD